MLGQKDNDLRTVVWMLRDRGIETTPGDLRNWIMHEVAQSEEHFGHFVDAILLDTRSFEAFVTAFSNHCVYVDDQPVQQQQPTREVVTNHIIHHNTHSTRTDWNATTVAAILGIAIGILAAILGGWTR